jgi:hypothetical protein
VRLGPAEAGTGARSMTVLLMTGTIRPADGARELARVNVADRIADYRLALQHNLGLLRQGVISGLGFFDNSGHGMEPFETMVRDSGVAGQVELVSYAACHPAGASRFFGECGLLREAFARSALVAGTSDSHVWKITGRYIVRNLSGIIRASEGDNDLILHCRNHPIRYVDFGLVGFSRRHAATIIERILQQPSVQDRDERMVRDMLDAGGFRDLKVRPRFSAVPDFVGVRGSDNASYEGFRYRLRFRLRSVAHKLLPRVWL